MNLKTENISWRSYIECISDALRLWLVSFFVGRLPVECPVSGLSKPWRLPQSRRPPDAFAAHHPIPAGRWQSYCQVSCGRIADGFMSPFVGIEAWWGHRLQQSATTDDMNQSWEPGRWLSQPNTPECTPSHSGPAILLPKFGLRSRSCGLGRLKRAAWDGHGNAAAQIRSSNGLTISISPLTVRSVGS